VKVKTIEGMMRKDRNEMKCYRGFVVMDREMLEGDEDGDGG
jgi:hypothetical protein